MEEREKERIRLEEEFLETKRVELEALKKEVTRKQEAELADFKTRLEATHKAELERLRQDNDLELEKLKLDRDHQLKCLRRDNDFEVEQLRRKLEYIARDEVETARRLYHKQKCDEINRIYDEQMQIQ
jgi:hypothetical protein